MTVGVLVVLSAQNVKAMPDMSPQDLYKQSDTVFYGQVITKDSGPGPDYYYYQVKVSTFYKNPQSSDSITVAGHKPSEGHMAYPQFEVGDKVVFYIVKQDGILVASPWSIKAGEGCDIHAFLGPAPIPGEPIVRSPPSPLEQVTDVNITTRGPFKVNQALLVSYHVWNNFPQSSSVTVQLSAINQNDTTSSYYKNQTVAVGPCDASTVNWNFAPTKVGYYIVNATENGKFRAEEDFDVVDSKSDAIESHNLTIHPNPDHYELGQNIYITYHIAHPLNNTKLSIDIFNPLDNLVANKTLPVMENETWIVSTNNSSWSVPGNYTIFAQYGASDQKTHFYFGGYSNAVVIHSITPLQQLRAGTAPKDVTCRQGLWLIFKTSDGSPACVWPNIAQKLIDRGWAKQTTNAIESSAISNSLVDIISIQMVPPPNPGGPIIQLTLKNIGMKTITNLKATLELNNDYTFDFKDITESKPLTSGHSTFDTQILIGAGFRTELAYPLTISGIANNIPFRYSVNIYISS